MGAPQPRASPVRSAGWAPASDLEHRIAEAERALDAREARLQAQTRRLRQHLARVTEPRFLAPRLGAAAAIGIGLWWVLRRSGRSAKPAAGAGHTVPTWPGLLLGLLPLAWPMLPHRWRHRVSPSTAASLLALLLPLVDQWLVRRRARGAEEGPAARTTPPSARPGARTCG